MVVIGDSSALVALAVCDQLSLLDKRFDQVYVPHAVFDECTVSGKTASVKLGEYLKDKVIDVSLEEAVVTSAGMGRGELEAMSLYKKQQADFLLIDDRRARKVAVFNGLTTIGSIGILIWGKQAGHVSELKPMLDLINQAGIFLSGKVQQQALHLANET